jgi:tellurium resistance protein TerD
MSDIAINLEKGQKIELTKTTPGLTKVQIGGGWDVNKNATGSYDVDISAYLVDVNEKIGGGDNIVYFNHKKNPNGSVDRRRGRG